MCNKSQGFYGLNSTLSPAAKAVLNAALDADFCVEFTDLDATVKASVRSAVAAALRAAADQVVPQPPKNWDLISTVAARECEIRKNLIAIAAELEGGND